MIVRTAHGRLRLVLQTDHAQLCGQFASSFGGDRFHAPAPRGPVRLAALMHDDGWLDWEASPRILPDSGRPFDFLSLPTREHVDLYRRGIALAVAEHPYAGLLVSLHGAGLYKQRYGHMPHLTYKEVAPAQQAVVDEYLAEQQELQERLLADLRPDEATLWAHYRWLQAWDLLSLFICLTEPAERSKVLLGTLPRYPGGPEETLVAQGAGPGVISVSPWPFGVDELELLVPVRYVPDRFYRSDEEFQEAFHASPTESVPVRLI